MPSYSLLPGIALLTCLVGGLYYAVTVGLVSAASNATSRSCMLITGWRLLLRKHVQHSLNKLDGFHGPAASWPTGQLLEKFLDGENKGRQWRKAYGPVYRVHSLFAPEVVITNATDVQNFYSDSKQHVKSQSSNAGWWFHQLLGQCLGLLNGDEWMQLRKVFEPGFTHRAVRLQSHAFSTESRLCIEEVRLNYGNATFDPATAFRRYPFWCTAISIYGPLTDGERAMLWELAEMRMGIFGHILKGGVWCTPLARWSFPTEYAQLHAFRKKWHSLNDSMFRPRDEAGETAPIVTIWRSVACGSQSAQMVLQTLDEMLFANIDVTNFVLSTCLTLLAQNPHVQDKLRIEAKQHAEELEAYCNKRDTYLHACIIEAMRLKPFVAFSMPEESPETKVFSSKYVPRYTSVIIDAHAINTDANTWGPNTLEYKPERFLGSKMKREMRYSLFTFGMGHRQCLGKELAETLIGELLAHIVLGYRLSPQNGNDNEGKGNASGAWSEGNQLLLRLE